MPRSRSVPAVMHAPTHGDKMKPCLVTTECAIHTMELAEGHFACIVLSTPNGPSGALAILDRDEVEAHILLLRNAMDDAERLDRGEAPVNNAPTLTRQ